MSERLIRRGLNWEQFGAAPRLTRPQPTILFQDTFDGFNLDPSRWGTSSEPYGSGNLEEHWYAPGNVAVTGGALRVTARQELMTGPAAVAPAVSFASADGVNRAAPRQGLNAGQRPFSSGLVDSRNAGTPRYYPLFSQFEIRAKVPHGQGVLPAFWIRRNGGASYAEVDIMEYFFSNRPGETRFSVHFPNSVGSNVAQHSKFFETPKVGLSDWHTWGVAIRPTGQHRDPLKDPITFTAYLDGVAYAEYTLTDELAIRDCHMVNRSTGRQPATGNRETWDICLNLAVGGRWVGAVDQQLGYLPTPNVCSRSQELPAGDAATCDRTGLFFAQLPATFEVDSLTVYDLGYTQ